MHTIPQAAIPAGSFVMGDSTGDGHEADGELPLHRVEIEALQIDAHTVTNADFTVFVDRTGYRTDSERYGYSAVFHLAFEGDSADVLGKPPATPWWLGVKGADWKHPGGPSTGIHDLGEHPVVHVSWNDAVAYAEWAGRRLPTEAEWEYVSRGGLESARYPWGDELHIDGTWNCNIWQGQFPRVNDAEDGFMLTAPSAHFTPNGYGVYQTVGNVWEWCQDWFSPNYYRVSPTSMPPGPTSGTERILRGGSFLCHDSYCNRYRNSARSHNTPDSAMSNTGFRTVATSTQLSVRSCCTPGRAGFGGPSAMRDHYRE